jgi:hypothetical protein
MNEEKKKEIVEGFVKGGEMSVEEQNLALKKELETTRTQMLDMADKFQKDIDAKNAEVIETKIEMGVSPEDDRMLDFAYKTTRGMVFKKLPQKQALQELVDWYRPKKNKSIDTEIFDTDTNANIKVNQDPLYIRLRKRDLGTGRYKTKLEVVPLWIAADRVLQGQDVEIVSKAEYDKATEDRMVIEREFNNNYYNKRRLKAIEDLAKMPDTL